MLSLSGPGGARLLIAAALSLALHAALLILIDRQPGGAGTWMPPRETTPLIVRFVSALTESVRPTSIEIAPAAEPTPVVETPPAPAAAETPAASPAPAAAPGTAYYFRSSELDRRPFPLDRIEVPPPASAPNAAGAVMIRLRLSERGRVEDASILFGTGIAEFEQAALREFANARFHPGYRGNIAVRSEILIEVTLKPPPEALSPVVGSATAEQKSAKD